MKSILEHAEENKQIYIKKVKCPFCGSKKEPIQGITNYLSKVPFMRCEDCGIELEAPKNISFIWHTLLLILSEIDKSDEAL